MERGFQHPFPIIKYNEAARHVHLTERSEKMTAFFMPMIPPTVTAQERRVTMRHGKPVIYDSPEIKDAKSKICSGLIGHRPEKPYKSAVRLVVKWCFPKGRHRNGEYKATPPDTDNLQKMLKDCMTECGFWTDDALVASEICEKFYTDITGIYIKVDEL